MWFCIAASRLVIGNVSYRHQIVQQAYVPLSIHQDASLYVVNGSKYDTLIYWDQDNIATISQTTFSIAFYFQWKCVNFD